MQKKKTYKSKSKQTEVKEPLVSYGERRIHIFKSFEEQEAYELNEMASLSSEQILQQLRKFITIAYGMYGYNPNNLPQKHTVKIIHK